MYRVFRLFLSITFGVCLLFGPIPGFAPAVTAAGDIEAAEVDMQHDIGYPAKDDVTETGQSDEHGSAGQGDGAESDPPPEPGSAGQGDGAESGLPPDTGAPSQGDPADRPGAGQADDKDKNDNKNDVKTVYIAAYTGDTDSLPGGVKWDDIRPFLDADAYDTVTLTGMRVSKSQRIAAIVEVIPRNLVYFLGAGADAVSEDAYCSVAKRLEKDGHRLYNGQRLASEYADPDGLDDDNYPEYNIFLPKGDYEITAELCSEPADPGETKTITYVYSQGEDGYLGLSARALDEGDGDAALSFIGIEFVGKDGVAGVEGGSDIHVAAYPREPDSLPQTVDVRYKSGRIEPAAIIWGDMDPFFSAQAYDAVVLTGTVEGFGLKVTATIEVIPRNIMYFIDAGASAEAGGNGSAAYGAVKAKLAEDDICLLNSAPDQPDNGKWGVCPDSGQFTAELAEPAVMPLDRKHTYGYAGPGADENNTDGSKYIEYKLRLPVGEYMITTGHYDCWGAGGENPRAMNILFNGEHVHGPIEFGKYKDSAVVGNKHTQSENGALSIIIESAAGDGFMGGASLTFIGVEYLGEPEKEA